MNETSLSDGTFLPSFAGTLVASVLAILGIALGSFLSYRYQRMNALEAENRRRRQEALGELSGIIPLLRHLMIIRSRAYAQHHWRRSQAQAATNVKDMARFDDDMAETREKAEDLLTQIMESARNFTGPWPMRLTRSRTTPASPGRFGRLGRGAGPSRATSRAQNPRVRMRISMRSRKRMRML